MKKEQENIDNAIKLKGNPLSVTELQLVKFMGSNDNYELHLDKNGNVAYRKKP